LTINFHIGKEIKKEKLQIGSLYEVGFGKVNVKKKFLAKATKFCLHAQTSSNICLIPYKEK